MQSKETAQDGEVHSHGASFLFSGGHHTGGRISLGEGRAALWLQEPPRPSRWKHAW